MSSRLTRNLPSVRSPCRPRAYRRHRHHTAAQGMRAPRTEGTDETTTRDAPQPPALSPTLLCVFRTPACQRAPGRTPSVSSPRRDVLVDAEQIGRVVLRLDRGKPVVVVPIGGSDALRALLHHEVDVGAAGGVGV